VQTTSVANFIPLIAHFEAAMFAVGLVCDYSSGAASFNVVNGAVLLLPELEVLVFPPPGA